MNQHLLEIFVTAIGASHFLQPPLTYALARQLGLKEVFSTLPPLAANVARNMAAASVALPTAAGGFIAWHALDIVRGGPSSAVAWAMALFWIWRLYRQVRLRSSMPYAWNCILFAIFCVQGPVFLLLLLSGS